MITASGLRWEPTNTGPSPCTRLRVAARPARNSRNDSTSGVLMGRERTRMRTHSGTPRRAGSGGARLGPDVDARVHRVLVDPVQFIGGERGRFACGEAVVEL